MFCQAFTLTLIYKPIFKSIRPKLGILSPKILQKTTKMAISQNPIHQKAYSPWLLHFSMNLSESFRINVNMYFAHIQIVPIFNLDLQKNWILGSKLGHKPLLHDAPWFNQYFLPTRSLPQESISVALEDVVITMNKATNYAYYQAKRSHTE